MKRRMTGAGLSRRDVARGGSSPLSVNAGTDSGVYSSGSITLNAPGASGGTGSYTHQWTKVSGAGTPTWVDSTNPLSAVSFSEADDYTLRLTATDSGSGVTAFGDVTIAFSELQLGARIFLLWDMTSGVTHAAGLISQVDDLGPAGKHATVTGGSEMTYNATGGPGSGAGLPYASFSAGSKWLRNSAVGITTGKRLSFYVLGKPTAVDGRTLFQAHEVNAAGDQGYTVHFYSSGGQTYFIRANFVTAGLQSITTTNPAFSDADWIVFEQHYDASITVSRIAGTNIVPAYGAGSGEACQAVDFVEVGNQGSGIGGGGFHYALIADATTAGERALIYAKLAARIALVLLGLLVSEGDSITANAGTYARQYQDGVASSVGTGLYAVGSSRLPQLEARAAEVDGRLAEAGVGVPNILTVMVGINDLFQGQSVPDFLTDYASYLDDRRAAGWHVVLCTILPCALAGMNVARNTANATLVTWVGSHCDTLCDLGAHATMGPDAAASDVSLYSDGTHPTAAGHALLLTALAAVVDPLL